MIPVTDCVLGVAQNKEILYCVSGLYGGKSH